MFERLFAESGLSLDRLRALVEVGAAGSIVAAVRGDAVRQSQYSRQIKELEAFFGAELIERTAKGIEFTPNGRELARIARFSLLGLSNFQRGCRGEERIYRIGGSATFIQLFVLPLLTKAQPAQGGIRYEVQALDDDSIERRLHDLTVDFGFLNKPALSRPLQKRKLLSWQIRLLAPKKGQATPKMALRAFYAGELPFVLPKEVPPDVFSVLAEFDPVLVCENFVEAKTCLFNDGLPCFLPDFIDLGMRAREFHVLTVSPRRPVAARLKSAAPEAFQVSRGFHWGLAWNPRLLRLNPQAERRRDFLLTAGAK